MILLPVVDKDNIEFVYIDHLHLEQKIDVIDEIAKEHEYTAG